MNCAQIKEQLVDFLYDEMSAQARASFAEHLRGCPGCSAELSSYQKTLGHARAALDGPLAQEPPARVHLAVLAAAKVAAVQTTPAKRTPRTEEPGFFARLWRAPWLLPAFGAASIATAVFLVRVLKNPEVLPGQQARSIDERAIVAPEPTASAPAASAPVESHATAGNKLEDSAAASARAALPARTRRAKEVAQAAASEREPAAPTLVKMKKSLNDPLDGLSLGGAGRSSDGGRRFAEPPPPRPASAKSVKSIDDLSGFSHESANTQRRAQTPTPPVPEKTSLGSSNEDRLDGLSGTLGEPSLRAPQPKSAAAQEAKPSARSVTRPAGASAGKAAPAYAPLPAAAKPAVNPMRDYPAESAAGAPAPSAPQPSVVRKKMNRAEEAADKSSDLESDSPAKDKKAGEKGGPSLDESLRKADRLFAGQDWNAAAAAYRDLVHRFPGHKDAPKWRDRMNESNAAYQRTLEAKRKKTVSDDPLGGSKL